MKAINKVFIFAEFIVIIITMVTTYSFQLISDRAYLKDLGVWGQAQIDGFFTMLLGSILFIGIIMIWIIHNEFSSGSFKGGANLKCPKCGYDDLSLLNKTSILEKTVFSNEFNVCPLCKGALNIHSYHSPSTEFYADCPNCNSHFYTPDTIEFCGWCKI